MFGEPHSQSYILASLLHQVYYYKGRIISLSLHAYKARRRTFCLYIYTVKQIFVSWYIGMWICLFPQPPRGISVNCISISRHIFSFFKSWNSNIGNWKHFCRKSIFSFPWKGLNKKLPNQTWSSIYRSIRCIILIDICKKI